MTRAAASAKICAATSHADAATDPAATALAGAANKLSIAYEAASGDGAPASLVAASACDVAAQIFAEVAGVALGA